MAKIRNHNKNKLLEKHKKQFAMKRGYKSWSLYREKRNVYDYIGDLHEIAANAIEELEAELKRVKEIAGIN
jgi:hypothetical protein